MKEGGGNKEWNKEVKVLEEKEGRGDMETGLDASIPQNQTTGQTALFLT